MSIIDIIKEMFFIKYDRNKTHIGIEESGKTLSEVDKDKETKNR